MSSAKKAPSLRRRIVAVSLSAGALLFLLTGGLILFVSWSFMTAEYQDFLTRITDELVKEYVSSNGDREKIRHFFDEDVEEHGADRIFLLLTDPKGREALSACADKTVLRTMVARAQRKLPAYRISKEGDLPHRRRIVLRVRTVLLPDGFKLSVGHDVTADEQYLLFLAITLGGAFLLSLLLGGWAADWLARRFIRSLRSVSDAADRIKSGDWSTRVKPSHESQELILLEDAFNTMLEISQTGCQLDRTPREDIDLCTFLRETADLYSTVLDDQGLKLSLNIPEGPALFSGHRGRLQRLLGNLLDNAIKFTPRGGAITLSLARTETGFELRVADTGCGIAPADLPHIFRRFWRSDSSRTLPGNGLGLALAKAIVTSYGGAIACESEPGTGTTFTITL